MINGWTFLILSLFFSTVSYAGYGGPNAHILQVGAAALLLLAVIEFTAAKCARRDTPR